MTEPICTSHWCLVMSFCLKVCIYSHTRGVKLGLGLGFMQTSQVLPHWLNQSFSFWTLSYTQRHCHVRIEKSPNCCYNIRKGRGKREREVVCGQVWWPILRICPLHLTHPSAHSQQWTHTRSSGQPCCGARGAVGGSVPCSRVSPQSWYWRWREHLLFTPPTDNSCRTWESNLQPLGYKSNSLTIRPRLPQAHNFLEYHYML